MSAMQRSDGMEYTEELLMDLNRHWEQLYETKSPEEVSWYESHLTTSLEWIMEAASSRSNPVIDVGGGASTLVDDLHTAGFRSLTALDISHAAIARSQARLGTRVGEINWIVGDIRHWTAWCSL